MASWMRWMRLMSVRAGRFFAPEAFFVAGFFTAFFLGAAFFLAAGFFFFVAIVARSVTKCPAARRPH